MVSLPLVLCKNGFQGSTIGKQSFSSLILVVQKTNMTTMPYMATPSPHFYKEEKGDSKIIFQEKKEL